MAWYLAKAQGKLYLYLYLLFNDELYVTHHPELLRQWNSGRYNGLGK